MIARCLRVLWVLLFLAGAPVSAVAQNAPEETTETAQTSDEAAPQVAIPEDATPTEGGEVQPDEFAQLAERAEALASNEDASLFAISRLRAELVFWRDFFLSEADANQGRLATVDAQIAALGPVPESGEEAPSVADRRAELEEQRQNIIAPRLLAEEAHARADGLIREFDARVLQRETEELTERGPTPLQPTAIAEAVGAVVNLFAVVGTELAVGIGVGLDTGNLIKVLPRAALYFIGGLLLVSVGRNYMTRWRNSLSARQGRWVPLMRFTVSFVQIAVPLLGLVALTEGLEQLGIFGLRGADMVDAIPAAGFCAVFGWWVSRHVFPLGAQGGYLSYDEATRAAGRRYTLTIAWVLAISVLVSAGLRTMEMSEAATAASEWPVLVILGILLWLLGRVIQTPPESNDDGVPAAGRSRGLIGRYCTVVAILSPAIGAIGFNFAAVNLMSASILSLGLIAVVFLIQRISHDLLEKPPEDEEDRGLYALLPVFVTFTLYMLSLPLFALIWGARVDDLLELWARFQEGFSIGETRLSPTDFLLFAFVFVFGYLLTRFIQGMLRRSVLPRTRLDLGAQNAVVAGFGYVGIVLAAIFAITSAGLDLSNLAIVAGALSVGIGFGLQNIVSNFVSGIILLIERPVSEGDWIEVGGQMGYVRAISVRSTRIETFDRRDVIIPNADLVSGQVTNWTRGNLVGRVIVPVGVAYGTDTEKVTKILQDVAEAHPLVVADPPPAILFQGFGADSLDFEIRAILRDVNYVLAAKSEMNHEIAKKFAEAGIEIPFAQRDIWLRNPEVLKE
ncbi:DUF3772 domain-containing protein [Yoonia litorea]|uniref:Small-conductance mechanosensitive channel n=1 Tax=Yoonia litorea TaxID=1123755 RepID=A0A1I6M722_9RHOB|nr:DUF3772 domain-containing protein [Yoonia litorea]SFS11461.1 Small-conductance mechanosensitive channel [Yoonia litorea]